MKPATVGFCLLMGAFLMSNPASAAERQHFDLVVALDISKSLSPAQLEQAASKLGEILEGLPPKIEFGIVTFADEARWLRPVAPPGSGSRANAALVGLEREGSFTVLYDALFQSAADLAGGVVLLVGDGVDEQSAVLHEDVVRRFEANSVRVVSVATGRAVDERALRRLAMLTGGAYL
ncbi:MAG: vWA domain-containing protein, partial [Acidobacteriota bacterium]